MRKRLTNKHLPERVYIKHGAYYYLSKEVKWIRLGKTLPEAMARWATMVEPPTEIYTMQQLFDRYMLEIAPQKAKESYRCNRMSMKQLAPVFGHMRPEDVTAPHIYKFLDMRSKTAKVRPNRDKALLSHVFSYAIRWGILTDNPCEHVKRLTERPRDRYVTDEEFRSIRAMAPDHFKNLLDFTYVTGLRQADVLKVELTHLRDDGIYVEPSKNQRNTQQKILIQWTDELRKIVTAAKQHATKLHSMYLFPNLSGKKYTSSGFQSNWQKIMKKALKKEVIAQRFHFHDIRRKTATDIEDQHDRESARKLLGHTDQRTTAIYISGVQKVKPLI